MDRKPHSRWSLFTILILAALTASACGMPQILGELGSAIAGTAFPTAAAKVYPTRTPLPWPTFTPVPSPTPYGDSYQAELFPEQAAMPYGIGIYSPLKGYSVTEQDGYAIFSDTHNDIWIYAFETSPEEYDWNQTDQFAKALIGDFYNVSIEDVLLDENPQVIMASGYPGSWYPYSIYSDGRNYEGAVVIYALDERLFVGAIALADLTVEPTLWDMKGAKDLRKLAESFLFVASPMIESDF